MTEATTVGTVAVWAVETTVDAMIAATVAVELAAGIAAESTVAPRLVAAAEVVVMTGAPATVVAETAETAAVEIAAEVEAGKKAEEENLPAPGLVSVSANAM